MKKSKENVEYVKYVHLVEKEEKKREGIAPKGYIPVIVGNSDEQMERFLVHLKLFKKPQIVSLLDMAAREFGYHQPGVLRIPCNLETR
ncbi:hypothetical protein J5N97_009034 [Dioscorea zingiberensis]|uniref:Small auxin up regulated protein n=1 Tax=Dioscorea zingiberensis TaxID=325984 RepID=A0A9D5HLA6_9LILI|nr:hypothetical protein J5N97_009034 [Dioscorea zingiberensis]